MVRYRDLIQQKAGDPERVNENETLRPAKATGQSEAASSVRNSNGRNDTADMGFKRQSSLGEECDDRNRQLGDGWCAIEM